MTNDLRHVFVCHASEDKDAIVRPLVEAFNEVGISCWYDVAEIKWGDSVTAKVSHGLRVSRYVVVVISPASAGKHWPERELNAVLNQEASTGEMKVLPLLVGTPQERHEVMAKYPLLNDKMHLVWDGDAGSVARAMLARLNTNDIKAVESASAGSSPTSDSGIPLPRLRKRFTQLDKDIFLKNGFGVVKQYFAKALAELARQNAEVKTDIRDIDNTKFTCTVYVHGDAANRCTIRLGGFTSPEGIAYAEGSTSMMHDNSINDLLSVEANDYSIGFAPSAFSFGPPPCEDGELLSAEQAAEYFWRKFIEDVR